MGVPKNSYSKNLSHLSNPPNPNFTEVISAILFRLNNDKNDGGKMIITRVGSLV